MPALAVHRERRCERLVRAEPAAGDGVTAGLDPVAEMWDRAGSECDVDERITLEDPVALRLRVAPADRDHEVGPAPLARGRLSEIRGELRVGLLPDRAGVEDDDVCLVRLDGLAETE